MSIVRFVIINMFWMQLQNRINEVFALINFDFKL